MIGIIQLASVTSLLVIVMMKAKQIKLFLTATQINVLYNLLALRSMFQDNLFGMHLWEKLDFPDKRDLVAIVTGGGRGLGAHVVKGLLKCGMTVVVGVRKTDGYPELVKEAKELPGKLQLIKLDTSSMKSVSNFAKQVLSKYPEINIVVNNAAIIHGEYLENEDGFEMKLATNYIGHFLLCHLLLPALQRGGKQDRPSRIVHVSSCAHATTYLHFDDINMKKHYVKLGAYGQSKLAQLMFSRYLDTHFAEIGSAIRSLSVHPGIVFTNMSLEFKDSLLRPFFKSEQQGAAGVVYACLAPDLPQGAYLHNNKEGISTQESKDTLKQEKLFKLSCDMLQIKSFFKQI